MVGHKSRYGTLIKHYNILKGLLRAKSPFRVHEVSNGRTWRKITAAAGLWTDDL